mmetsp:Transcript_33400/g.107474  ORF Transcript_33400/g.107474 Transcript_33400/m.107474 type:complete len:371 (+) Transcript_33400:235-1347(+)
MLDCLYSTLYYNYTTRVESRASTESGVAGPPGAGVGLVRPRSSRLERRRLGLDPRVDERLAHLQGQVLARALARRVAAERAVPVQVLVGRAAGLEVVRVVAPRRRVGGGVVQVGDHEGALGQDALGAAEGAAGAAGGRYLGGGHDGRLQPDRLEQPGAGPLPVEREVLRGGEERLWAASLGLVHAAQPRQGRRVDEGGGADQPGEKEAVDDTLHVRSNVRGVERRVRVAAAAGAVPLVVGEGAAAEALGRHGRPVKGPPLEGGGLGGVAVLEEVGGEAVARRLAIAGLQLATEQRVRPRGGDGREGAHAGAKGLRGGEERLGHGLDAKEDAGEEAEDAGRDVLARVEIADRQPLSDVGCGDGREARRVVG